MTAFRALYLTLSLSSVALFAGCTSMGETEAVSGRIKVSIGQVVLERPEKVQYLKEERGVEHLHDYLQDYLARGDIKRTIRVDISITEFRVGAGRDVMGIEVHLFEDEKELKRFHLVDTTSRGSVVKRLTKSLAGKTYDEIRRTLRNPGSAYAPD